jgi:hypothetical protein
MKKYTWPIAISVAAGLTFAGVGLASASIPDSTGVIHACYASPPPAHGSALKVIDTDAGGTCGGGNAAVNWRSAPTGTLSAPYVVSTTETWLPGQAFRTQTASCNSGDRATGGGYAPASADLDRGAFATDTSQPILTAGQATGWSVGFRNEDASPHDFTVYALCSKVSG